MRILLPIFCLLLLVFIFHSKRKGDTGLRLAWLYANLTMGVLLVISTEALSSLSALTQNNLMIFWTVLLVAAGIFFFIKKANYFPKFRWMVFENNLLNLVSLFIPIGLILATFIIAIVAPPNNTDSMVYHMSRVAHWAQAHSLSHFATSTLRELYLNPLAEYGMLHTYLLSGSDRFVNLIQWMSYINGAIVSSLIAGKLGAGKQGQYLTCVFALTIPQAILQATTTQNDLILSSIVLVAVYLIISYIQEGDYHWILLAGIATALAVLTKSTSFFALTPFLIYLAYRLIRKGTKQDYLAGVCSIIIAILLIFPFYMRNYFVFNSPLGPQSETQLYSNETFNLKVLVSNSLRNLALNFSYTPEVSNAAEKAVIYIHSKMNISESDPATTWQDYKFSINPFLVSEDLSSSPLHVWLVFIALIYLFIARKRFSSSAHLLAICLIAGFLMFSGFLKWQPWNNRLQLVFFLMAAPLFGLTMERKMQFLFIVLLSFTSIPYFLFNPTKPIRQDWNIFNLPRIEMMIRNKTILGPYVNSSIYLRDDSGCDKIGMDLANGYWEYPFWQLLVDENHPLRTLEHINVNNESKFLEIREGLCAIIMVNDGDKEQTVQYTGTNYNLSFVEQPVAVYTIEKLNNQ